jgi:hypothetical protein
MPDVTQTTQVSLAVVVYSGRPQLAGEQTYQAKWQPSANVVTLMWSTQEKPAIRKGGWILEAPIVVSGNLNPNGYFYRVVNVTDGVNGPNTMDLELSTNRRAPTSGSDPSLGFVVIMDGAVEVFERGQ